MKKLIIGIGVLFVLIIGALLIVPSLIPSSVYKERIQTQLTKELQRDVTIEGEVKLSVFPLIKARTGRVVIDNPEGFQADTFASMDALDARVKLWPLFSKRVEIASFSLKNPSINLEKRADGEANWVFGEPTEPVDTPPSGPFKRDGRYGSMDPQIGKFSLENGAISYRDAITGADYDVKDANLAFSLPSLAKPVSVKGDFVINDEPVDVNLRLDTPRAFLDGQDTPVSLDMKTAFADLKSGGRFLASEEIAFELNMKGEISNLDRISQFIPSGLPLSELADTIKLDGTYSFDGVNFSVQNASIDVVGNLLEAAFSGNARMVGQAPILDGKVDLDVSDLPRIATLLGQDIDNIELTKTLKLSAQLAAQDNGFSATNIDATVTGDGVNGTFKGSGAYGDVLSAKGDFTGDVVSIPSFITALDMDMPQAAALGSAKASGRVDMQGDLIRFTLTNAQTSGDKINATFSGSGTFNETLTMKGDFKADSQSVPALLKAAQIDMPQAAAIERFDVTGQLDIAGETVRVNFEKAETSGETLRATYKGALVQSGDSITLNGQFDSAVTSLKRLATITSTDIPYSDAIGNITAKGGITGDLDALTLSNIDARLSDGQLNGDFKGGLTTAGGMSLNGTMNADIPSLRNLASTTGTKLPPNTEQGRIYENVSISGNVTGNPAEIKFTDAKLALDKINGTGDFTVDMQGAKPELVGNLNLSELDLRPYIASYVAQNPSQGIQPWSEDPLNLNALTAVDGTFNISTPKILTNSLNLGQTDFTATVRNGVLTAKLPKISAYGGLGTLTATVDGSGAVPKVSMNVSLDDINSNSLLSSVAKFTNLKGDGTTILEVSGEGGSQAAIMKSLDGLGNFKIQNGEIAGVDLTALLSGLNTALSTRSLPSGIGNQYTTKFNDLLGKFTIQDGVISVNDFNMQAADVDALGSGQIDLGNQTIDFSLRPRLASANANNLAQFGIPLRLKGDFNAVKPGLDTDFLTRIIAEKAEAELRKRLDDTVGRGAGDILGGILGGGQSQTEPSVPDETETPSTNDQGTDAGTPEAKPEDALTNLFGSILGGQSSQTEEALPEDTENSEEQAEQAAEEEKEPTLEDALGSLFGGGSSDDE